MKSKEKGKNSNNSNNSNKVNYFDKLILKCKNKCKLVLELINQHAWLPFFLVGTWLPFSSSPANIFYQIKLKMSILRVAIIIFNLRK